MLKNWNIITLIFCSVIYNCDISAQPHLLKDTVRNEISLAFEDNKYFKQFKIFNIYLDKNTVKESSNKNVIFYEVVVGFSKVKSERQFVRVPVVECVTDSSFLFNFNIKKKKVKNNNKTDLPCASEIDSVSLERFKNGAIIQKEKIYLNIPQKERKD